MGPRTSIPPLVFLLTQIPHPAHAEDQPAVRTRKKNDITYCKQVSNVQISRTMRKSEEEDGKGCGVLENQLKRQLEHLSKLEPEIIWSRSEQ